MQAFGNEAIKRVAEAPKKWIPPPFAIESVKLSQTHLLSINFNQDIMPLNPELRWKLLGVQIINSFVTSAFEDANVGGTMNITSSDEKKIRILQSAKNESDA